MTAIVDNVTQVDVLANDQNPASVGGSLTIKDIVAKPAHGYVYINANGTLSYLTTKDLNGVTADQFQYLACNTAGYCSVGTVNVTVVSDGCAVAGQYATTTATTTPACSRPPLILTCSSRPPATFLNGTREVLQRYYCRHSLQILKGRSCSFILREYLVHLPSTVRVFRLTTSATVTLNATNTPFPSNIYAVSQAWTEGSGAAGVGDVNDVSWTNKYHWPCMDNGGWRLFPYQCGNNYGCQRFGFSWHHYRLIRTEKYGERVGGNARIE